MKPRGFACDVADTAAVAKLVADAEIEFGLPDILVNNAGLTRDTVPHTQVKYAVCMGRVGSRRNASP